MILKLNFQVPIQHQKVNIGYEEMNDDDDDDDNKNPKSPDANMVTPSEHWVWRDE